MRGLRGQNLRDAQFDVMQAFENFITAAKSGGGENMNGDMSELGILKSQSGSAVPALPLLSPQYVQPVLTRAALGFLLSDKGNFFREFLLDEVVKGIDAVPREQLVQIMATLGFQNAVPVFSMFPTFGPIKATAFLPTITDEDRVVLSNVEKVVEFLTAGSSIANTPTQVIDIPRVVRELLPVFPGISSTILTEVLSRLSSRIVARIVRDSLL